ncbi:LRFN5 [Mytilus edulis]|uniref:LRFN5 n=1 Tax=Mytilus edulis TaxID=6550 RepID=A0A8S3QNT1_MYTED|nr:LRFN5 [Mytilus edulis]
MEGLNLACFDPLSQQPAADYVQSVMFQIIVGSRMTTAADIHTENNVSKNKEKVANVGTKHCLSQDPNSKRDNLKLDGTSYANVVKTSTDPTTYDDSLVIRNLPETETENVVNKVISVFKDGLRLKDIQVVSAERKKTANNKKHGVVVVKLQSGADNRKVMKKKRELKKSRNFEDVFIETIYRKHRS